MTLLDDVVEVIPADWPACCFAGITIEQARILNSAVCGLRVEVETPASYRRWQAEPQTERYLFCGMLLPGHLRTDPFIEVGDLRLMKLERDGKPSGGSYRVLSASLVARFEVLEMEPGYYCSACSRFLERTEKVYDVASLGNEVLPDGEFEWGQRLECPGCFLGG